MHDYRKRKFQSLKNASQVVVGGLSFPCKMEKRLRFGEGLAVPLIFLVLSHWIAPSHALTEAAKNISKREAQLVDIIEHHALTFDIEKFSKDPILIQRGSYVKYINPKTKNPNNAVVLSKKHPDYGKDSVVLSSAENRFAIPTPRGALKRQFILLRRAAVQGRDPEDTKYHTSMIYVRNLYPNDTNKQTFTVDGIESVVEFDIWEHRPRKFFSGWSNCEYSLMFTCTSLEDIAEDAEEQAEARRRRRRKRDLLDPVDMAEEKDWDESPSFSDFFRRRRDAGAKEQEPRPELTPFQSEVGYDPGHYHDLYLDFDLHRFDEILKVEVVKALKVEVSQLSGKVKPTEKPRAKHLTPAPRTTTTTHQPKKKKDEDEDDAPRRRKKRSPLFGRGGRRRQEARRGGKPQDVNSRPGGGGGEFGVEAEAEASFSLGGLFGGKKRGGGSVDPLGGILGGLGGAVSGSVGGVGGLLGGTLGGVGSLVSNTVGGVVNAGSGLVGSAGAVLSGGLDATANLAGGLTGGLSASADLGGGLGGLLSGGLDAVGSLGGGLDISGVLSGGLDAVGSLGGSMDVSGMLGGILGGGAEASGSASGGADLFGGLLGSIGGAVDVGGVLDAGAGLAGGLLGSVSGSVDLGGVLDAGAGLAGGLLGSVGLGGGVSASGSVSAGGGMDLVGGLLGTASGALSGAVGAAGNLVGGLGGSVSAQLGRSMGGGLEVEGSVGAEGGILGPASILLGPVTGVLSTAKELTQKLPGMGAAVGHNIIGALAPMADSIGIGKVMESVGLGGILDAGMGIADSIVSTGGAMLSTWDTIGSGLIETAAEGLVQIGIPVEVAKLAALGGQLAFNSWSIKEAKSDTKWLGLRLGVDTAGVVLNGGRHSGKGLYGKDSVPANSVSVFGTLYLGAEGGRYFFFPQGSIIRVVFKVGDDEIPGWFKTNSAGGPDAFFPDGDGSSFFGKTGRIIPKQYEQEDPETEPGIVGTFQEGFKFSRDGKKVTGMYKPNDPDWSQNVWLPGEMSQVVSRPSKTPNGKKILYGQLFNGIEDSPHMFIAEGDSVSGVFVPWDTDRKEVSETPHGTLTLAHPAGNAIFVADDPREVININELRGVFMPDAMNLAGGFSGRLSKDEDCKCDVRFELILDKPSINFMYVPEAENVKNVWTPYLTADEWTYVPPEAPPEDEQQQDDEDNDPEVANPHTKPKKPKRDAKGNEVRPKEVSGIKVKTKKSWAFIPEMYPFDCVLFGIDKTKRYQPMAVRVILEKPDEPLKFTVMRKQDPNENLPSPLIGLLIPMGFPKEDGFAGHLFINGDQQAGTLKLALEKTSHFWTPDEEIWTPVGFQEKMEQGEEAAEEVKAKAEMKEEAKQEQERKKEEKAKKAQEQKQRAKQKVGKKPSKKDENRKAEIPPKKPSNLIEGRWSAELSQRSLEFSENENENADEYVRGFYLKSRDSPEPIFVPDTGVLGAFAPQGGGPVKAFYFAKRGKLESRLVPEQKGSLKNGIAGRFFTLDDEGQLSKGFIPGTFNGKTLQTDELEEVRGWEMPDQDALTKDDMPGGADLSEDYFKTSMKGQKYALVDLANGFKGVVVGNGKTLDDPNNPIFQQFLHFRSQQTGDVNPWGRVAIVNPIIRKKGDDDKKGEDPFEGSFKLPVGKFHEGLQRNPNGIFGQMMNSFSLTNWEFPDQTEFEGGAPRQPNMMGTRANVANLLDFRMYLYKKYSCKKTVVEGKTLRMFVPKDADGAVLTKSFAKPRDEWLQAIASSRRTMVIPEDAGVAGMFSALYNLDVESIAPFQRPAGEGIPDFTPGEGKKDSGDWKTSAPYLEWGDDNSCDVIELDEFSMAQALTEMGEESKTSSSNGISLGYKLVQGRGKKISYHKVSKKLLANYNRKMDEKGEKQAEREHSAGQTTDLDGTKSEQAERKAENGNGKGGGKRKKDRSKRQGGNGTELAHPTHVHARTMPGWKTQHRKMTDNATLSDNGIFFYGLGNCKWEEMPTEKLLKSHKPDQVIQFYLRIMRIHCMEGAEQKMVDLVNQGFLELAHTGMYFVVPEHNNVFHAQRLTPAEIKKLSIAFEFHAFTKTYAKRCVQVDRGRGVITEPFGIVSRSIDFLTEMALYYINNGRRVSPTHAIRLNRNILMTLRSVAAKLEQDYIQLMEECTGCEFDKELTRGDRFRVQSLTGFIIHGLLPYNMGHQKLKPLFVSFEKKNEKAISQRVDEFARQFPFKITKEAGKDEPTPKPR